MQTKAPYDDGASKKGDLYSKLGKKACMSSSLKTLHNCFWIATGKILNEVQQDYGKRKKHCVDDNKESVLIMEKKKMRWTLPLGKSQRKEKINPAFRKPRVFKSYNQELSGSTKFSSPSPVIPSWLCQVSPIFHTCQTIIFHLGWSLIKMRPLYIFFHLPPG